MSFSGKDEKVLEKVEEKDKKFNSNFSKANEEIESTAQAQDEKYFIKENGILKINQNIESEQSNKNKESTNNKDGNVIKSQPIGNNIMKRMNLFEANQTNRNTDKFKMYSSRMVTEEKNKLHKNSYEAANINSNSNSEKINSYKLESESSITNITNKIHENTCNNNKHDETEIKNSNVEENENNSKIFDNSETNGGNEQRTNKPSITDKFSHKMNKLEKIPPFKSHSINEDKCNLSKDGNFVMVEKINDPSPNLSLINKTNLEEILKIENNCKENLILIEEKKHCENQKKNLNIQVNPIYDERKTVTSSTNRQMQLNSKNSTNPEISASNIPEITRIPLQSFPSSINDNNNNMNLSITNATIVKNISHIPNNIPPVPIMINNPQFSNLSNISGMSVQKNENLDNLQNIPNISTVPKVPIPPAPILNNKQNYQNAPVNTSTNVPVPPVPIFNNSFIHQSPVVNLNIPIPPISIKNNIPIISNIQNTPNTQNIQPFSAPIENPKNVPIPPVLNLNITPNYEGIPYSNIPIPPVKISNTSIYSTNIPEVPNRFPVNNDLNNFNSTSDSSKIPGIPNLPITNPNQNLIPTPQQISVIPKVPQSVQNTNTISNIPQIPVIPNITKIPGIPGVPPVNNQTQSNVPSVQILPGINKIPNTQLPQVPGFPNPPLAPGNNIPPIGIPLPNMMNPIARGPQIKDEFSQKKKETLPDKKENTKQTAVVVSKPSVLLPSRQQNINIVLSKIRLTPIAIVEALISYDHKTLTSQTCDLLLSIVPTSAEINQVDSFDGDPMTLADSDKFVLLMKTAPGYDMRLKAILFQRTYKEDREEIVKRIQKFFDAFDFISTNKKFHKWLEIVLAYGNYLNGSSNRGGAYGYRLDILSKIAELKSNDNKKNLMMFIVEYIGDVLKEDDLLRLNKDLEIFATLSFSTINDLFKDFTSKFTILSNLLQILQKDSENIEDDDKSAEFLESFYSDVEDSKKSIQEGIKRIEEEYTGLIKKFGDTPKEMPMETLIEILNKFGKDITANVAAYMRGRELREKMEKKKQMK